jgi:PAS domain-containing protein
MRKARRLSSQYSDAEPPVKVFDSIHSEHTRDSSEGENYCNPLDANYTTSGDASSDSDVESVDVVPIRAEQSFFAFLSTAVKLNGEQGLRYALVAMMQLPALLDSFHAAVKSSVVLQQVDRALPSSQIWLRMHFVEHVSAHVLNDTALLSILDNEEARLKVTELVRLWNKYWPSVLKAAEGLETDPSVIRDLSAELKTHYGHLRRVAVLIAEAANEADPSRYRPMNFLEAIGPWPLACLTLLGLHIAALIQAILGFIVYNWPKAFGDIQWRLALAGFVITMTAVIVQLLMLVVMQSRNVQNAKTWKWLKATLPAAEAATRRLVIESSSPDLAHGGHGDDWRGTTSAVSKGVLSLPTVITASPAAPTSGVAPTQDMLMETEALMRTTPIICLDNAMNITFFNDAAEELTGFTRADAIGRNISALVTESSMQHIQHGANHVRSGLGTVDSANFVTILSIDHYMVQLRFTYTALATSARDNAPISGVALVGRQVFDLEQTNDVFLVRYRHAELLSELPKLRHILGSSAKESGRKSTWHLDRCIRIVKASNWPNISVASHQMKQWRAMQTRSVLDTISRNHMHVTDLSFARQLPDFVECDAEGICMIISELLQGLTKRCTIKVDVKYFDLNFSALSFNLKPLTYDPSAPSPLESPLLDSLLVNIGASLAVEQDNSEATLLCPHLVVTDNDDTSHSFRQPGAGKKKRDDMGQGKDGNAQTYTFSFVLFEPNSIFRHTVSMGLWGLGHSVTLIESPSGVEKIIGPTHRTVHCALIDGHSPVAPLVVREITKLDPNVHIVLLVEGKRDIQPDAEIQILERIQKPLRRAALEDLLVVLSEKEDSRNKRQKELEEQRQVLSAHRSAPWHRGKKLGSGSFADVYVATSEITGAQMAVKIIYLDRLQDTQAALVNEIGIMCKLSHPNIVHYFYCEEGDKCVNLFMELCIASLQTHLRDNGKFNLDEAVEIMRQVLTAVEYLHSLGLVHRDIKPGNVLIGRDGKYKLADFGTATKAIDDLVATAGTFKYMAPEVFNGEQYGQSCDIWSVGILYLDLIGKLPPPGFVMMPSLIDDLEAEAVTLPPGLESDAQDFLSLCLKMDKTQRPSAGTLLHHPFFLRKDEAAPAFTRAAGGAVTTSQAIAPAPGDVDPSVSADSDSSDLLPGM